MSEEITEILLEFTQANPPGYCQSCGSPTLETLLCIRCQLSTGLYGNRLNRLVQKGAR